MEPPFRSLDPNPDPSLNPISWTPQPQFMEKFGIAKMTGNAYVDGQLAVEVQEFTFALAKDK